MDGKSFLLEPVSPDEGLPPAVLCRLRQADGKALYVYEFLHPAVAATVAVFDRSRGAFLLIRRERAPFAGAYAFPGGFIDVGREDIYQTAVREAREEAGVQLAREDLVLVDVRSRPDRDPRDHVFDIGFLAEIDRAHAQALDETTDIRWASPREIDALELAFDHAEFWANVKRLRAQRQASP